MTLLPLYLTSDVTLYKVLYVCVASKLANLTSYKFDM